VKLAREHLGQLKVHFPFASLGIWNLPKKKRGILRLHHNKLDEALGKLAALRAGLDFSHGSISFRRSGMIWRSHRRQNIRLIAKIFSGHAPDIVKRDCFDIVFERFVMIETEPVKLIERALVTE